MCDCRKDIEGKLMAQHKTLNPDAAVLSASLSGYGWNMRTGGKSQATPYAIETTIPVKAGGMRRKVVKGQMVFNYCPFCGVKTQ